MSSDTTVYFPVQIGLLSGTQETVTLSVSGLPAGVVATPTSVNGIPSFSNTFTFTSNHAAAGTYKITVTASSVSTGTKNYSFNLTIFQSNCLPHLVGTYAGADACISGIWHYTSIATASTTAGKLSVNNLGGLGTFIDLDFTVDCAADSITIFKQQLNSRHWLRGHGSFTSNTITIHYGVLDSFSAVTDSCTAILTK